MLATEDTERYKKEMAEYNSRQEAKMRSEALKPAPVYPRDIAKGDRSGGYDMGMSSSFGGGGMGQGGYSPYGMDFSYGMSMGMYGGYGGYPGMGGGGMGSGGGGNGNTDMARGMNSSQMQEAAAQQYGMYGMMGGGGGFQGGMMGYGGQGQGGGYDQQGQSQQGMDPQGHGQGGMYQGGYGGQGWGQH